MAAAAIENRSDRELLNDPSVGIRNRSADAEARAPRDRLVVTRVVAPARNRDGPERQPAQMRADLARRFDLEFRFERAGPKRGHPRILRLQRTGCRKIVW